MLRPYRGGAEEVKDTRKKKGPPELSVSQLPPRASAALMTSSGMPAFFHLTRSSADSGLVRVFWSTYFSSRAVVTPCFFRLTRSASISDGEIAAAGAATGADELDEATGLPPVQAPWRPESS